MWQHTHACEQCHPVGSSRFHHSKPFIFFFSYYFFPLCSSSIRSSSLRRRLQNQPPPKSSLSHITTLYNPPYSFPFFLSAPTVLHSFIPDVTNIRVLPKRVFLTFPTLHHPVQARPQTFPHRLVSKHIILNIPRLYLLVSSPHST